VVVGLVGGPGFVKVPVRDVRSIRGAEPPDKGAGTPAPYLPVMMPRPNAMATIQQAAVRNAASRTRLPRPA
jgi:hypothetical protein